MFKFGFNPVQLSSVSVSVSGLVQFQVQIDGMLEFCFSPASVSDAGSCSVQFQCHVHVQVHVHVHVQFSPNQFSSVQLSSVQFQVQIQVQCGVWLCFRFKGLA